MSFAEITRVATPAEGTSLSTVPAHGADRIEHEVPVPVGMCPRSGNPTAGTITLSYECLIDQVVEVVSLHQFIEKAHKGKDAPRSSEAWAQRIAKEVATAVRGRVDYVLDIDLVPAQSLVVRGWVMP